MTTESHSRITPCDVVGAVVACGFIAAIIAFTPGPDMNMSQHAKSDRRPIIAEPCDAAVRDEETDHIGRAIAALDDRTAMRVRETSK